MDKLEEQNNLIQIYSEIPMLQPTDIELSEMFEYLLIEEIPNLPHGFGQ